MLSNNDQAVIYVLLSNTIKKFELLLDDIESDFSDENWDLAQEVSEQLDKIGTKLKP